MRNEVLAFVFAAALSGVAAAQSKVFVVSPSGPVTIVQNAVNGAMDGDTVLIKSGSYAGFTITNKSVNVVADNGAGVTVTGTVKVANLAAARTVTLIGLHVTPPFNTTTAPLELTNDAGSVRVENCSLIAAHAPTAASGAKVLNCADVIFERCMAHGGRSLSHGGGCGLRATNSSVAAYDCDFLGDQAGTYSCPCQGSAGGHGALIETASFLFASNSSFQGGHGGNANTGCLGCSCGADGGSGGNGLTLYGNSIAKLLDDGLAGGPGGNKDCGICGGCGGVDGPAGVPIWGPGATVLNGTKRTLSVANPVRELASFTLTAQGTPGDQVFVWVTPATKFRWVPTYRGVQFNVVTGAPHLLGTIGSSGSVSRTFAWGDLGGSLECGEVFLQGAALDPSGSFTFTGVVSMVVLDQAF